VDVDALLNEFNRLRLARIRGQVAALYAIFKRDVVGWPKEQAPFVREQVYDMLTRALWFEQDQTPRLGRYARGEIEWRSAEAAGARIEAARNRMWIQELEPVMSGQYRYAALTKHVHRGLRGWADAWHKEMFKLMLRYEPQEEMCRKERLVWGVLVSATKGDAESYRAIVDTCEVKEAVASG
jgi:hypothetical protein